MRRILQHILAVLDGKPTVHNHVRGRRNLGQSVAEMTLVTPLLIILLVGIVEIGWFANNYLILLEVTRVGARRAAVLSGDNSPLVWNEFYALHPRYATEVDPHLDPTFPRNLAAGPGGPDESIWPPIESTFTSGQYSNVDARRVSVRNCASIGDPNAYVGFYNLVLCQMLNSLDPIRIDPTKHQEVGISDEELTDDIVISVFSVKMINNTTDPCYPDLRCDNLDLVPNSFYIYNQPVEEFGPGWNPVVVGRFPALTNECNTYLTTDGSGDTIVGVYQDYQREIERDPFDPIADGTLSFKAVDKGGSPLTQAEWDARGLPNNYPVEMFIGEVTDPLSIRWVGYDPPEQMEAQRGFVFTGYHRVEGPPLVDKELHSWSGAPLGTVTEAQWLCYGSEFNIYDVQNLLRTDGFILSPEELQQMRDSIGDPNFGRYEYPPGSGNFEDVDARMFLQDQGVVLVEIHWKHTLLLDLPVFSPVFNALGGNTTVISVWSAFPVPAAVPQLKFDLTWQNFYTGG